MLDSTNTDSRIAKARAAAAVKAERKAVAGLSRTVKLRLYPTDEQAEQINRTIGTTRFCWNVLWLPMLKAAEDARREYAKAHGESKEAWKEAWRLHPDPSETAYNRARIDAAKTPERAWIGEALAVPLTRAVRNFAAAVKANRGQTQSGGSRKVRTGRVQPRSKRDDCREGLEWQLQGNAPLGGKPLAAVVERDKVNVPSLGQIKYKHRGHRVRDYIAAGVEACEMTVKRQGAHYYVCIAVRGLQPAKVHAHPGSAVGIDMGVANPLATSDGELVTHHQGHDIAGRLARLERRKLRAKRQYARKLRHAAKRAGALTPTGAMRKGVRIEHSNRMRRTLRRVDTIDQQIVGYRRHWQSSQALQLVRDNELVAVEALTIRNMTASAAGTADKPGRNVRAKAGLNRSILSRGWGSMRQKLKNKAQELCGRVVEVDPAYTSQTCPQCEHVSRDNRKTQAAFACSECGYTQHADIVGATNILARGMSAGIQPVAGRGGLATVTEASALDGERPVETSNKSRREPLVSRKSARGSRGAKPRTARNELATPSDNPREHERGAIHDNDAGSRIRERDLRGINGL